MRLVKHALFLLGLVGVLGVFIPLAELRDGPVGVTLSARQLSFGLERAHGVLERKLPRFAERHLPGVVRDTRDDVKLVAGYLRWAVLVYLPSALLAAIGLFAVWRQRLGRGLAAGAVGCGLISLASWIGMHDAVAYALAQADLKGASIELMLGAHLLLVPAVAGLVGGLAAMIRPAGC
jgi:hypothetical protein